MIQAVHIARYRGIRELTADGFGRVNIIIGRNDCGKTAFMEALQLAEDVEAAAYHLLRVQSHRLGRGVKRHDFDRFWRPIFFDLNARAGLSVTVTHHDGTSRKFDLRQDDVTEEIVFDESPGEDTVDDGGYEVPVKMPMWVLRLQLAIHTREPVQQRIVSTPSGIKLPPMLIAKGDGSFWIPCSPSIGELEVQNISALKERGEDSTLLALLREVDGRLSSIELLAPGGELAELFVRLNNGTPMLPIKVMGEGFQRCVEIGAAAAAHDWPTLFVDEIENGMHHLVLEPLWRWIAMTSRKRNLQVFATTHSEECIHAACRAFQGLDDDGLRVIRLDRLEKETRATIYDRTLVEAAERTGTEIRG